MRSGRKASLVSVLALAATLPGCGDSSTQARDRQLVVSAASSLSPAFEAYANSAGIDAKQSFAGSDTLAAQIRQGIKPDVYAAANTFLPEELHTDGLVSKPKLFATNSLVLAVPVDSPITSLDALGDSGVSVAIGDQGVPIGDYTQEVLDRLPAGESSAILGNVRSREPDVAGIVGKLTEGGVDAGFAYATDVEATDGALRAIRLPLRLEPEVAYGVATVEGAGNPAGARSFIDGLLSGAGAEALRQAGFGPPPR